MSETYTNPCLAILSRSRVFQAAPSADLERLALRCSHRRYRRGDEILRAGSVGHTLVVVGRGRIKGTLPSPHADGELIVGMFWPGDLFGEPSVFDQGFRPGTTVAVTEAEVVFVPRAELLSLLERRPAVAIRLLEGLCDKLRTTFETTLGLRFLDTPTRLYRRLLYLGRHDSRPEGYALRIQHGLSQQELGDSIGASREALNKQMAHWRRLGLIDYGRGYVLIPNLDRLSQQISPPFRGEASAAPAAHPSHEDTIAAVALASRAWDGES